MCYSLMCLGVEQHTVLALMGVIGGTGRGGGSHIRVGSTEVGQTLNYITLLTGSKYPYYFNNIIVNLDCMMIYIRYIFTVH